MRIGIRLGIRLGLATASVLIVLATGCSHPADGSVDVPVDAKSDLGSKLLGLWEGIHPPDGEVSRMELAAGGKVTARRAPSAPEIMGTYKVTKSGGITILRLSAPGEVFAPLAFTVAEDVLSVGNVENGDLYSFAHLDPFVETLCGDTGGQFLNNDPGDDLTFCRCASGKHFISQMGCM
jgi:hypothetical protein